MGLFEAQDTHVALEELLLKEREAIMNGQYDRLERMTVEKESLLKALSKTRLEAEVLARLREQTERNGILLDAMRAGVGSALERLRAIQEPSPGLQTYDEAGRKKDLTSKKPGSVRRA